MTPGNLLRVGEDRLRGSGLTRQKTRYCLALAGAIRNGTLELAAFRNMPDEAVREALQDIPGIGRWTADIYLFLCLGRPDVWPRGDLALDKVVTRLAGDKGKLAADEIEQYALRWRPFRAVAARMLWQDYLADPARYRLAPAG